MSSQLLRRLAIAISVIGIAIAGYLTYVHYAGLKTLCLASGGCEKVQSSHYADFLGVPVALLGLIGYALILFLLLLPRNRGLLASTFASLVGFGFSAYLTYLELFRIKAICQWCVASAVLMTLLAAVCVLQLLYGDDYSGRSSLATEQPAAKRSS